MSEHDKLVSMTEAQKDPYHATADDFKANKVTPATGQGVDGGGKDKLVPLSKNQEGARNVEAQGGEGDSMASKASGVASFKVGTNSGEGEAGTTSMPMAEAVDLTTGKISCKGYKATVQDEVADRQVSL